jgi:AcrR family transcriptional regulator
MPTKKVDRRGARTRELVLDAFFGLMVERGFEKMTVQDLLDRSGVGRATFYAHFKGKEDLLASSIGRLQGALRQAWKRATAEQNQPASPLGFARYFLHHVEGNRSIFDLMVGRPSEVTIERHMRRMLGELVREDISTRPGGRRGSKSADVAVQFVTGALWSLMVWWFSTRARLSADELHAHFQRLAEHGLDGEFGRAPLPARPG